METKDQWKRILAIFALAVPAIVFGMAARSRTPLRSAALPRPDREAQQPENEFTRLAALLAGQRLGGGEESQQTQERALGILDAMVLETLNAQDATRRQTINQRLAALAVQQPPVGEEYHLIALGGRPPVEGLVANFGLGGPSAVRLYAVAPSGRGAYALAGRIDRFVQKDFFDENLEVVPIGARVPGRTVVFVTVAGRTDDLQTGVFTAWWFDGERVAAMWTSDLVQQSSYEVGADGFRITYCAQTDDEKPRVCKRMVRDRYDWDGVAWRRAERSSLPVPKR